MSNNELTHYGILGMKWGTRRASSQSSGGGNKGSSDKPQKKTAKDMSDDELRKVVNRLQMERQYSQLSSSKISKGKEYAQKLFKAGTTVAAVTTTALTLYNNAGKIKAIFDKIGK